MTPAAPQKPAILLGIETSGDTCAVGLSREGRPLLDIAANIRNIHSRELAPFVALALEKASLETRDISALVLSAGPGSFTGLRIGYSFAKGLAHALAAPIIEVPTLDVWAYHGGARKAAIVPLIDARRGEVFCAVYRWKKGRMVQESDYTRLPIAELNGFIPEKALLSGSDAARLFPELQPHLPRGAALLQPAPLSPPLWALLALGFEKYRDGRFADTQSCEPLYMRTFQGAT